VSLAVRPESEGDRAAVRAVLTAAFAGPEEADLVDALRGQVADWLSLVAEEGGGVVGHILFTPITVPGHPRLRALGLAPMAVLPGRQCQGIGSALVRAGLEAARELGFGAVVVLGHPAYYPRFGFRPAHGRGLACVYDAPPEAFLALELVPGALEGVSGTVHYHPAFGSA